VSFFLARAIGSGAQEGGAVSYGVIVIMV